MSATKLVNGLSVVLAVAVAGFAIWQTSEIGRVRAAVADERRAFRAQLGKLEERLAQLEELRPAAPSASPAANQAGLSEGERRQLQQFAEERRYHQELAKRRAQEAKERAVVTEQFRFSPEVQQLQFRQFEVDLAARYRPLYRRLGLSAGQVTTFERLMTERYWAYSDLLATRAMQGAGLDDGALAAVKQQTLAPFDEGLHALIGDAGVEQYQNYERAVNAQGLIQNVAGRLFDTAEPLSSAQADRLLTIFADYSGRTDTLLPGESWLLAKVDGRESSANAQWADIDWSAARPKLEGVLSPQQIAAVQALRDQAEARQQVKFLQDEFAHELRLKYEEKASPVPPPR